MFDGPEPRSPSPARKAEAGGRQKSEKRASARATTEDAPRGGAKEKEKERARTPARSRRRRKPRAEEPAEDATPELAPDPVEPAAAGVEDEEDGRGASAADEKASERPARAGESDDSDASDEARGPVDPSAAPVRRSGRAERRRRWQERRRRRRLGLPLEEYAPLPGSGQGQGQPQAPAPAHGAGGPSGNGRPAPAHASTPQAPREPRPQGPELREVEGLLVLEKANHGELRRREHDYLPSKDDVGVPPWLVQKLGLRDGALVRGRYRRGQGRNRWELVDVQTVDGLDPRACRSIPTFKNLVTIDPDFHYALGDGSGEVSLKVIDVLCPIGRGQRGLIVAPPRSGKTILLQQIAKAVETIYPDVHLMVLLIDERPEEATEWKRSVTHGEVFVSTNDEPAKKHVELAEVVWRRARRLVELGKDVILLLDSITRLGRAANNVWGNSGKTMSGGIDTRALERPKTLFGSARNTEKAGSLTILGTTLIETGSRMDQVIFEEFKGTGNMELVLSRKLADRRIFPAIDIERSGTRKDEKLHSSKRLARINTLRRVLMRMHFAEAMELLITKLEDAEKLDDFLQRFDIDPDAGDEGKQAVSPVRMRW